MKTFKVRGKHRKVGTVKHPSAAAMAAQHAKGFFHEIVGTVPTPPSSVDYLTPAKAALATMLGNGPDSTLPEGVDPVGDCVIAEDLHLAAERACNAGAPWVPTTADALAAYSAVTGYVQGDASTDQGTDPLALVAWRKAGNAYPDGSVLLDAISVDATNETGLQQAIWLATGCFAWASLPDGWESEEDGGDVWDVDGDGTLDVVVGTPSTVQIVGGKYTPTDADGDALTITGVTGTTNLVQRRAGRLLEHLASRWTSLCIS